MQKEIGTNGSALNASHGCSLSHLAVRRYIIYRYSRDQLFMIYCSLRLLTTRKLIIRFNVASSVNSPPDAHSRTTMTRFPRYPDPCTLQLLPRGHVPSRIQSHSHQTLDLMFPLKKKKTTTKRIFSQEHYPQLIPSILLLWSSQQPERKAQAQWFWTAESVISGSETPASPRRKP